LPTIHQERTAQAKGLKKEKTTYQVEPQKVVGRVPEKATIPLAGNLPVK